MLAAVATAPFSYSGAASARPSRHAAARMEGQADLKVLAEKLNPVVGYWDPLELSTYEFWDNTNEETIGWLRHAEIKHGRVAMAGFVGYVLQANGAKFPWAPFDSITATTPPEQWDALPEAAKWQIILGVGFLEWWSEIRLDGTPHYMKGGKPGYMPDFDAVPDKLPHWVGLNLWDPFKFTRNLTPAQKEAKLVTEINNGRLAMLGLFSFLSESKIPGSVPFLKGVIPAYGGEYMAPFEGNFGF
jgi:hypothetical protein